MSTQQGNTKNTGRFRRLIFRLIGPAASRAVIRWLLRKKIDRTPAAFTTDLNRCSDILFILPVDRVEMVFQLETLFSVIGRYKESSLTFICPTAHSSFVSGLKNVRVINYDPGKFQLYSMEHSKLVKELASKTFDICVMLEKKYTLAHLYLIGISRAHLRVGWDSENCSPFLNVRIVPIAEREGANLWERNSELAKILNAETDTKVRWGVQKSTAEEVAKLLGEHRLKREPALICVDLGSLEDNCGTEWCAELLRELKSAGAGIGHFYIFGGLEGEKYDFKDAPFPILPALSVPRTAALIACTDIVISGVGLLLGLAQISASKIIPIVTKEQAGMYCKQCGRISPTLLPSGQKPDAGTVKAVIRSVKALAAPAQKTMKD